MKVKGTIIDSHRRLSLCSVKFLEFVQKEPGALKRGNYDVLSIKNSESIRVQPWPTFINGRTKARFKEAAIRVFDLIKTIPGRFFQYDPDKISRYYHISPSMAKFFLGGADEKYIKNLVARGDFILSPHGLKCLEYNIFSNLGGMEMDMLKYVYAKIPVISKFFQDYQVKPRFENIRSLLYEYLVKAVLDTCDGNKTVINTALVIPGYVERFTPSLEEFHLNQMYGEILQAKFNNRKGSFILCDYNHLQIKDGGIFYKEQPIDCLYEWYAGFVPFKIMEAAAKGEVLIFNGPFSMLISAKLNLALLSEHEDSEIFSIEERNTIKEYIPWTRRITDGQTTFHGQKIDLVDYVLANKEKFVLKPLIGYGGQNIFIGLHTPVEQWKELVTVSLEGRNWQNIHVDNNMDGKQWLELVEQAVSVKNWLVQEYVDSCTYLYQAGDNDCAEYNAVWGLYVFGTQYAGEFLRIQAKDNDTGIINSRMGAEDSIVFEVDE